MPPADEVWAEAALAPRRDTASWDALAALGGEVAAEVETIAVPNDDMGWDKYVAEVVGPGAASFQVAGGHRAAGELRPRAATPLVVTRVLADDGWAALVVATEEDRGTFVWRLAE